MDYIYTAIECEFNFQGFIIFFELIFVHMCTKHIVKFEVAVISRMNRNCFIKQIH